MKTATIIGHFGIGSECLDGQTIKTKKITKELLHHYGENEIATIDTHNRLKSLIKAPSDIIHALKSSKNVIILPAHNSLMVYAPLLAMLKKKKRNKIHYVVIGGWLPKKTSKNKFLRKILKLFDKIYVETSTMQRALEAQGFNNIEILPNFKASTTEINLSKTSTFSEPYKLCIFSRIMKEKGIEDAVNAVNQINAAHQHVVLALDIYGQIDANQISWFERMKDRFGPTIHYHGSVPTEKSVEIIQNYFALLFPTRFYTEGIPGTIIDAYAAGVPVICSKWESFSDVVEDGVTGIGYEFDSFEGLINTLSILIKNPEKIQKMRAFCFDRFRQYTPSVAMKPLLDNL